MSRRLVRNTLLALLVVVFVVLVVWMVNGDLDHSDKLASIVGTFLALPVLAVTVMGLFPAAVRPTPSVLDLADDLAHTVRDQWYEEAKVRRLRDPKVLPLTWSTGRMEGKFDGVTRQLAEGYRQVRSERLVVLGEPGSGKTVLAILLTLGLLNSRSAGSAVPVLLAASSWDPIQESMDDWVVHTLATSYYNGQQDIPRALLDHGLLLPILDGLDEIPESARRSAVRGVNEAIGADRPVVVTCRAAEYDDVIEGGAPVLRQAPVVRVMPVAVTDVVAYLKAVPSWPNGTSWNTVFDDLEQRPDSAIAAALSTPLMLSLARTIYQRCGGDPAELLDVTRFDSRHTVEDYLVDHIIAAAYAPDPLPSGELATAPASGWDVTKVQRWLTFLARYLHRYRERDLAWWRLSDRLVSPWMAPGIGVGLGVPMMIAVSAGGAAMIPADIDPADRLIAVLGVGAMVGGVIAVMGTVLWYGGVGCAPGRMAFAVRGSLDRLRRGFTAGVGLVAILVLPVLLGAAVTIFISRADISKFSDIFRLVVGLLIAVALACVVGFAVAAHHWLNALPERSTQASPFSFVQQDRRSSLVGALVAGVVTGMTIAPAFAVAGLVGEILGQRIAGGLGEIGTTSFTVGTTIATIWSVVSPIQVIGIVAVPGMIVFLLVLLTRAWLRFAVARVVLAVRAHLPWRLLTFLADARNREILRQSGGMYQFRHIRLQERLAAQPGFVTAGIRPPAPTSTTTVKRRRIRVGAVVIVLTMVITSTAIITLSTFNYLRCDSPLSLDTEVNKDQIRSFTSSGSVCVGIIPEAEWDQLGPNPAFDHTVFEQLRAGNDDAKGNNELTVAVFGPLSSTDSGMSAVLLRQLDGVVLAQRESKLLGRSVNIVLVNTGADSTMESESAAFELAVPLVDHPGINMPAVVTLSMPERSPFAGSGDISFSEDERIPVFSADVRYFTSSNMYLGATPLSETRAPFDRQLRESLLHRFLQYTLKNEGMHVSADLDIQMCGSAERPVLVYEEVDYPVELYLDQAKACGKKNMRLVAMDSSVADYLHQHVSPQDFPNLTVYYPVAETTSTTRRCEEIPVREFPANTGLFADADVAAEFSCQATLNAVGMGNFVVNEMRADQGRWITKPVLR